ncbi:MAG: hypothetical protein BWY11_00460 [Firmicutes bacterium ADurb.Bin182]|nr:MAG: hypothetical protein BWY11_00460 [Firmicutes bacterium ADurb.Bin182]
MKQVPFIVGVVSGIAITIAVLTAMFPEIPMTLAKKGRRRRVAGKC